jgi:hypothetical protein
VDPSGNFFQFVIAIVIAAVKAAVVGAAVGAAINASVAAIRGEDIGEAAWRGARAGAASGALLGAGGFAIGAQGFALAGTAKTLAEIGIAAASGAVGGGVDSHIQGGSFNRGLLPGAVGGVLGYGASRAIGAVAQRWGLPTPEPGAPGQQLGLMQSFRQWAANAGANTRGSFDDIMQQVERVNVSTPPGGAVFWSGFRQGNQAAAMKWAQQTGRSTIEMTPGGRWLTSLDVYGPTSPFTRAQADAAWRRLSQRFAEEAQGEASAFLKGTSFNPRSTFYGTELPTLYGNPHVPRIRIRDQ